MSTASRVVSRNSSTTRLTAFCTQDDATTIGRGEYRQGLALHIELLDERLLIRPSV